MNVVCLDGTTDYGDALVGAATTGEAASDDAIAGDDDASGGSKKGGSSDGETMLIVIIVVVVGVGLLVGAAGAYVATRPSSNSKPALKKQPSLFKGDEASAGVEMALVGQETGFDQL